MINPTGPYGNKTDDKPFVHKHGSTYYLSWGCFYSTASSVYGPYTYDGSVIDPAYISPDFHIGNQSAEPWYTREDYHDRHGSFFESHNQWYFATNDCSHSTDILHPNSFRDTVVGYLHYYPNGSMAPVVINATGVGTYLSTEVIEAENYFRLVDGVKVAAEGASNGFGVSLAGGSTRVTYPNVQLSEEHPVTAVRVAYRQGASGVQRLVIKATAGQDSLGVVATCMLEEGSSSGSSGYEEVDCSLVVSVKGHALLEVEVAAEGQGSLVLDWLRLV